MAAFFSSSESQRAVIPNVYAKDTNNSFCPDSVQSNMTFANYSTAHTNSENFVSFSRSPQQYVEFPIADAMLPQHSASEAMPAVFFSNLVESHLGNNVSSSWRNGKLSTQPRSTHICTQNIGQIGNGGDFVQNTVGAKTDLSMQMLQLGIFQGGQNLELRLPDVSAMNRQGLSLSLDTQVPFKHLKENPDLPLIGSQNSNTENSPQKDDDFASKLPSTRGYPVAFAEDNYIIKDSFLNNFHPPTLMKPMHMNALSGVSSNLSNTIPSSRYLKAAQQLLDEVVNVRDALTPQTKNNQSIPFSAGTTGSKEVETRTNASENHPTADVAEESTANPSSELSPAERQDLQIRMTQLLTMLDEVDGRYKQYQHQMQIVVSSFDAIAGCGAAKTYTALALQTISRHFRCLRDAISSQILSTRKSLGEEDAVSAKNGSISRLRFVDQQLRQQRALQQLEMIQPHAWRPQRGLPESSVTILRAWLFEHFLHPYPKDSDKLMLARQTGLSRSQVSNWFINARVRLWKPMVEEMYKEETGETELDSISSSEYFAKEGDWINHSEQRELQSNKNRTADQNHTYQNNSSKPESLCNREMQNLGELGSGSHVNDDSRVYGGERYIYGGESYISFEMEGVGKMHTNAGVSLTLGLQHCDGTGLSAIPNGPQSFVTTSGEDVSNPVSFSILPANYENRTVDNRRQRFRPSQVMHDFVA